jgi:alpha-galactosidase
MRSACYVGNVGRFFALMLHLMPSTSLDNGQGRTPALGFNPWTAFRAGFNQSVMLEVAHAMVDTGLKDAGYVYVNLDCGWTTGHRDSGPSGRLQVDTAKFPNMSDYGRQLHDLGLKFGMYAGGWHAQCCHRGKPGSSDTSWQHWDTDAAHFAELGIDYLKSDPCCGTKASNETAPLTPAEIFNEYNVRWKEAFSKIGYLDKVFLQGSGPGRALNVSGCAACGDASWPRLLNSWRTTGDVKPTFASVMSNIHENDRYALRAGPGSWNDADMLQCGQPGIALGVCRLVLSLWSLAKSPMLIGADVRHFSTETLSLLKNPEMIAVSQDSLGEQGRWVAGSTSQQVWAGRLSNDRFAVTLVNMDNTTTADVQLTWAMLPGDVATAAKYTVRDLWARTELGVHEGRISLQVAVQDSRMLVLTPHRPEHPRRAQK